MPNIVEISRRLYKLREKENGYSFWTTLYVIILTCKDILWLYHDIIWYDYCLARPVCSAECPADVTFYHLLLQSPWRPIISECTWPIIKFSKLVIGRHDQYPFFCLPTLKRRCYGNRFFGANRRKLAYPTFI